MQTMTLCVPAVFATTRSASPSPSKPSCTAVALLSAADYVYDVGLSHQGRRGLHASRCRQLPDQLGRAREVQGGRRSPTSRRTPSELPRESQRVLPELLAPTLVVCGAPNLRDVDATLVEVGDHDVAGSARDIHRTAPRLIGPAPRTTRRSSCETRPLFRPCRVTDKGSTRADSEGRTASGMARTLRPRTASRITSCSERAPFPIAGITVVAFPAHPHAHGDVARLRPREADHA